MASKELAGMTTERATDRRPRRSGRRAPGNAAPGGDAGGRRRGPRWAGAAIAGPLWLLVLAAAPVPAAAVQPRSGQGSEQETVFWQSVEDSTDPAEFEAYMEAFPEGVFVPLARLRAERLRAEMALAVVNRSIDELIASVADVGAAVSSDFELYLDGNRLVYLKEDCGVEDVEAPFIVDVYPADEMDLPIGRRQLGFEAFGFDFERYGHRGGGRCAVERGLPEYEIRKIHVGQRRHEGEPGWDVTIADAGTIDRLIASAESAQRIASSVFDVYLDGNRMVYVKENCRVDDVATRFILHVYPFDEASLRDDRIAFGFDNLDFDFEDDGYYGFGRCALAVDLPEYRIERIRTGQSEPTQEAEWEVSIAHPALIDDLHASVEEAQLLVTSASDVYLDGNRLVYVKDSCGEEDLDVWFQLHVFPADEASLSDDRRPYGFDNLDFPFAPNGFHDGIRCIAVTTLPDYEIASIRTGQFRPGQALDWVETIDLETHAP